MEKYILQFANQRALKVAIDKTEEELLCCIGRNITEKLYSSDYVGETIGAYFLINWKDVMFVEKVIDFNKVTDDEIERLCF